MRPPANPESAADRLCPRPLIRWSLLSILLPVLAAGPAQAAHPLITEDTGTQGRGNFQLEFTTEHATVREAGERRYSALTNAVVTYGFLDTADLLVTVPWLRLGTPDSVSGLADVGLDIKWRFFETGSLSMALKPGITFPTGDDRRGLGVGEVSWSLYHVTSWETQPWSFHLHLGHLHHNNTFNERVDIWHASASVIRQFGDAFKLALDVGIDSNTDEDADSDPMFAILGAIWSPRHDVDIDLGFRAGRTDTRRENALLAGLTVRW